MAERITFVGDIHGKVEAVEAALSRDGLIIFVGDFIDSFDRSINDHDKCYNLVIEAIEKKKARAIYGNHELSYLCLPGEMHPWHRCSGYDRNRAVVVRKHELKIRQLFEPYIQLGPDLLVSHAGLDNEIWKQFRLTQDNLKENLDRWWPDRRSPMHWIGKARGGPDPVGGLFWCDFTREFEPVKDLIQIFGHSQGKGIRQKGEKSFCIDCLNNYDKPEFFELEE